LFSGRKDLIALIAARSAMIEEYYNKVSTSRVSGRKKVSIGSAITAIA